MKTALEEKLHPRVSQEALRREFQRFRHLMPNYNEWLQFMHDERQSVEHKLPPITAKELFLHCRQQLAFTVPIVALCWLAVYFILTNIGY